VVIGEFKLEEKQMFKPIKAKKAGFMPDTKQVDASS